MAFSTAFLDFKLKHKPEAYAKGYRNPTDTNPYTPGSDAFRQFEQGQYWRDYDEDKMKAR